MNADSVIIQPYRPEWSNDIADLFHRAVHAISSSVYTPAQKTAWAGAAPDYSFWSLRLDKKKPWGALISGRVVGFIEFEDDGYIDCLYVDPDFQRKGVASALYEQVLLMANRKNISRISVDASQVAKVFFEQRGFVAIKENEVMHHGECLVNISMERY